MQAKGPPRKAVPWQRNRSPRASRERECGWTENGQTAKIPENDDIKQRERRSLLTWKIKATIEEAPASRESVSAPGRWTGSRGSARWGSRPASRRPCCTGLAPRARRRCRWSVRALSSWCILRPSPATMKRKETEFVEANYGKSNIDDCVFDFTECKNKMKTLMASPSVEKENK